MSTLEAIIIDQLPIGNLLQRFLVASYAYYYLNKITMTDGDYDDAAKRLVREWDTFDHPHKSIIDFDSLKKMSSLHYIAENDYPAIVRSTAQRFAVE